MVYFSGLKYSLSYVFQLSDKVHTTAGTILVFLCAVTCSWHCAISLQTDSTEAIPDSVVRHTHAKCECNL